MKSKSDEPLLTVLQNIVSTALKQWLDENKAVFLRVTCNDDCITSCTASLIRRKRACTRGLMRRVIGRRRRG